MLQNGTVFFFQNICADLDNVIRGYADDKGVVSGMMQLAQRQSILDRGLSFGHIVWNDGGGIEQFAMFQTAQSPLTNSSHARLDLTSTTACSTLQQSFLDTLIHVPTLAQLSILLFSIREKPIYLYLCFLVVSSPKIPDCSLGDWNAWAADIHARNSHPQTKRFSALKKNQACPSFHFTVSLHNKQDNSSK